MFDDTPRGEIKFPILEINWPFVNYLAAHLCWGCMPLDLSDPVYQSKKFKDMQQRVANGQYYEFHSLIKKKVL